MINLNKSEDTPSGGGAGRWRLPLALLLIAVMTVAAFWPVLQNGFIDYDDDAYVTLNTMVRQGLTLKGLIWSFTAFHAGNWHPLTWLSHMLDIELFGLDPRGHHAVSLLLHTVNALLLCLLLHRLTGFLGRSMVVALLFAVHPLHVESVAWVAERKDVLSTLFWLLTMGAYAGYAARPTLARYLAVAACFALGLMAKQMLVTLPLILLLADVWPLRRRQESNGATPAGWGMLLAEKVPLLLLAGAAALLTIRAQDSAGALAHGDRHSTLLSAGNAVISYAAYLGKMFWPADLALFYPIESSAITVARVSGALVLLAAVTCLVVAQHKRRPYLLFGWFWYLITLIPVIGFVRVGSQAMADRYTYIPLIGIFMMVAWGGAELAGRWRPGKPAAVGVTAVTVAVLSVLTAAQVRYWKSSYDLYSHALEAVADNWLAHNNLGILLAQQYRTDAAIGHFRESLRIYPEQDAGYRNLGNAYQSVGNTTAAIGAFRQAVRINPNDTEGHFRLGYAYLLSGDIDLAYGEYRHLQRLNENLARTLLDSIQLSGRR